MPMSISVNGGSFRDRLLQFAYEYERIEARCRLLEAVVARSGRKEGPLPRSHGDDPQAGYFASMAEFTRASDRQPRLSVGVETTASMTTANSVIEAQLLEVEPSSPHGSRPSSRLGKRTSSLKNFEESAVRDFFQEQPLSMTVHPSMKNGRRPSRHQDGAIAAAAAGAAAGHLHSTSSWQAGHHSRWAMDPDSSTRLLFECFTALVCLHDALTVPYVLAWNPPVTPPLLVLGITTVTFWIIDMTLNFFTGYWRNGTLVMNLGDIRWRYLTGWFIVDFTINALDLTAIVLELTSQEEAVGKVTLRVLRGMKLNRLLRVAIIINRYKRRRTLNVAASMTALGIGARVTVLVLLLNHVLACIWYWIGQCGVTDTGVSWLDLEVSSSNVKFSESQPQMQYFTALHWALTQMTPGSMEVVPQNSYERAWNVFCLVIGLFASALLISQLSAKMVGLQMAHREKNKQAGLLQEFLSENQISWQLGLKIQRQIRERSDVRKRLSENDVPALKMLSTTLRQELAYALYAPSVVSHTVFLTWDTLGYRITDLVCSSAVELDCVSGEDDVFVPMTSADKVFLLQKGTLKYTRELFDADADGEASITKLSSCASNINIDNSLVTRTVEPNTWVSEVALWLNWTYLGTMKATSRCEITTLLVPKLIGVLKLYPALKGLNSKYATAVSNMLAREPTLAIQADIEIDPGRVLLHAPADERCKVGRLLLDNYGQQRMSGALRELLLEEMHTGACSLCVTMDRSLLRTVALALLRIRDNATGSFVLMQVAVCSESSEELVPELRYPGTKRRECESADQAISRYVEAVFPQLAMEMDLEEYTQVNELAVSKSCGIRTNYIKTTFEQSLPDTKEMYADGKPFQTSSVVKKWLNRLQDTALCETLIYTKDEKGYPTIFGWLREKSCWTLQPDAYMVSEGRDTQLLNSPR